MDKPKVSVIVPVYNAEQKLNRCMESLFGQTLREMEFIFVNDASTDGSLQILIDAEAKDSRIKVIDCTENSGAGGARNVGLDYAEGEYIGFVDADDFIKNDMYEELYTKAKTGDYDIVDCPLYNMKNDSIRPAAIHDMFCDRELTTEQRELLILSDGYIVTKIFKSSLISEYHVRFRPKVKVEDADFLLKLILHAEKLGNISDPKYIYDNTAEEETWSVRGAAESEYEHILLLIEEYGRILKHDKRAKECETAVKGAILHFYRMGVECCLSGNEETMSEENLQRLLRIRKVKNNIFTGGYDNRYFISTANEAVIEFLKWVDQLG